METTKAPTNSVSTENIQNISQPRIGIYGWRKRCVYAFILTLLIMVIINIALSLWILKVMQFSPVGMGALRVLKEGLRLEGNSFIMNKLISSHITSKKNDIIVLNSDAYFSFAVRNQGGHIENVMIMGNESFDCLANTFRIKTSNGKPLFLTNEKKIVIHSECLKVTGNEGTIFDGSIQAPSINGDNTVHNLKLASPTNTLHVTAAKGIHIKSHSGNSKITAGDNIQLESKEGLIKLEALDIRLPQLRLPKADSRSNKNEFKIFQLCVCKNGKLFLTSSESKCSREWYLNCR